MGFFGGVDWDYRWRTFWKGVFLIYDNDVRKKNWPKTGKIYIVCFGPPSQSIGRGRLSRKGALDVRESRERRDKIEPKLLPEKRRKINAILA